MNKLIVKRIIGIAVLGFCTSFLTVSRCAFAEDTRASNPNTANVEILGRGLLYSVTFDRALDENLAAGVGLGSTPTKFANNGGDSNKSALLLPAYANYYFTRDQSSLFVTGGVDVVLNNSDVKGLSSNLGGVAFPSSGVIPTFGVGYENRSDAGFVARFTVYGLIAKEVSAWVGFGLGFAF